MERRAGRRPLAAAQHDRRPASGTVRVDAGATLGDLDHATGAFGLAVPSGFIANTGIAGLALGGGVGYLTRRFGFTLDNLLGADVVLADGTFVTASETSHPDLFWALRGGGGNFGIVTSFTFRCHPVGENGTIIGGPVFYDIGDTPAVLRWYRDLLPTLPEELNGWFGVVTIPPVAPFPEELQGRKACAHRLVLQRPARPGRRGPRAGPRVRVAASRGCAADAVRGAAERLRPALPARLQWYWRSDVFTEITDAAIEVHRRYGETLPTGHSTMHLYPIDGAAARVAEDATAFPYRGGGWIGNIVGVDPDPGNVELITQWTRDYFADLRPSSAGGTYVNFLMDEGEDRVRAAYRGNYDRLAQIKGRYDPENTFHVNQNIRPADQP